MYLPKRYDQRAVGLYTSLAAGSGCVTKGDTNTTGQYYLIILLKLNVIFDHTLAPFIISTISFFHHFYVRQCKTHNILPEAPTKIFKAIKHILVLDMSLGQHESSTKQSDELHLVRDEPCESVSFPDSPASELFHQAVQARSSNEVDGEYVSQDRSPNNNLDVGGTYHGSIDQRPTESQQIVSPIISGWQLKIVVFSYVLPVPKTLSAVLGCAN